MKMFECSLAAGRNKITLHPPITPVYMDVEKASSLTSLTPSHSVSVPLLTSKSMTCSRFSTLPSMEE